MKTSAVPVMLDPNSHPVKRNFVHVSDLVEAIVLAIDHPKARQHSFNICMDEPVDYRQVAEYLAQTLGLPSVEIFTPYWSTWLDNAKAKFLLGWRPRFGLERLIDDRLELSARSRRPTKNLVSGIESTSLKKALDKQFA